MTQIHHLQANKGKLLKSITALFNEEELKALCFELDIDYDNLPALGKANKIRELLAYCERHQRLSDLWGSCQLLRPLVPWNELLAENESEPMEQSPSADDPPYKGLAHFVESDAHLFFGREQTVADIINHLHSQRFLAIVGASGSGKSSVARAGLLPTLKGQKQLQGNTTLPKGSRQWLYHVITPTDHPLETLSISLSKSAGDAIALMDALLNDPRSLRLAARLAVKKSAGAHLLLVIDQFEELFTQCRSEKERRAFIENLMTAVSPEKNEAISVVITLRADFYSHCARYNALRQSLANNQIYLGTMNESELRLAIEEPARQYKWKIQTGLVDLLLNEVGQEPGRLPLLSHALLEIWQRRRDRTITFNGYISAGGLFGAISQTAETEFKKLNLEQQEFAKGVFLRLTELGNGTEDTRRRVALTELLSRPEESTKIQAVLNILAGARLITINQETVEVIHEALIREWPRLRAWLDEDRKGLYIHRRLTEAAAQWDSNDRNKSYLYQGLRLDEASHWANEQSTKLNKLEQTFLSAGLANRRRKQVITTGALAIVMTLILSTLLIFAESQRRNALREGNLAATADAERMRSETAEALARAQLLSAQGQDVFEENPLLGLRLVIEGLELVPVDNVAARESIEVVIHDLARRGRLLKFGNDIERIYLIPETSTLILDRMNAPGELYHLPDATSREALTGIVSEVSLSPNSNATTFVIRYEDVPGELRLTKDGSLVAILTDAISFSGGGTGIDGVFHSNGVSFSPYLNENSFIVRYANNPSEMRSTTDSSIINILTAKVRDTYYSPNPNATTFIAAYEDAPGELRNSKDGALIKILEGVISSCCGVVFSSDRDASTFIVRYDNAPSELRNTTNGNLIVTLSGQVSFEGVTYSPDPNASYFFVSYIGGHSELRERRSGNLIATFTEGIEQLTFSRDINTSRFVIDYYNAPGELHRTVDGALVKTLTDEIWHIHFSQDPEAITFLVEYWAEPYILRFSELRRIDDGTAIPLTGNVLSFGSLGPNYFLVNYLGGHEELRNIADGSIVPFKTENIDIGGGEYDPYYVIGYDNAPPELRRTSDSSLVTELTQGGRTIEVYSNENLAGNTMVVSYFSSLGELRHTDDGSLIATLSGDVSEAYFSPNPNVAAFLVTYRRNGLSEVWDVQGRLLTKLGLGLLISYSTIDENLMVYLDKDIELLPIQYEDGGAYLIDITWLTHMSESADTLSTEELVTLTCELVFAANYFFDERSLEPYLNEQEPQACR